MVVDHREELQALGQLDGGLRHRGVDEREVLEAGELRGRRHLQHVDVEELEQGSVLVVRDAEHVRDGGRHAEVLADALVSERAADRVGIGVAGDEDNKRLARDGAEHLLKGLALRNQGHGGR